MMPPSKTEQPAPEGLRIVQWQEWNGAGLEHLALRRQKHEISVESVVICPGEAPVAVHYRIRCDVNWLTRRVEIGVVGTGQGLVLAADGLGGWTRDGEEVPELEGALDPDLTITPFTNTLPIRRLRLSKGQSAEIKAAFVVFPQLDLRGHPQRYTCLDEGERFLYESLTSDFRREIKVDRDGLVVAYPGFWRML